MDAQTTVNKLCEHLLGKDWYTDAIHNDMVNDVIFQEITAKYKTVDESPVDHYRRTHKKCKFCAHMIYAAKHDVPTIEPPYFKCVAKYKKVNPDIPRPFCKVFKLSRK